MPCEDISCTERSTIILQRRMPRFSETLDKRTPEDVLGGALALAAQGAPSHSFILRLAPLLCVCGHVVFFAGALISGALVLHLFVLSTLQKKPIGQFFCTPVLDIYVRFFSDFKQPVNLSTQMLASSIQIFL